MFVDLLLLKEHVTLPNLSPYCRAVCNVSCIQLTRKIRDCWSLKNAGLSIVYPLGLFDLPALRFLTVRRSGMIFHHFTGLTGLNMQFQAGLNDFHVQNIGKPTSLLFHPDPHKRRLFFATVSADSLFSLVI